MRLVQLFIGAVISLGGFAFGAIYTTTITGNPVTTSTLGVYTFDTVKIRWETPLTVGTGNQTNLSDLRFELFNGSMLIYTDQAITAGTVQPLAGAPRTIADLFLTFDLSVPEVTGWDNKFAGVGGQSGDWFHIYGDVGFGASIVDLYTGINPQGGTGFIMPITSVTTIPEPSRALLIAGSLVLLSLSRRRGTAFGQS